MSIKNLKKYVEDFLYNYFSSFDPIKDTQYFIELKNGVKILYCGGYIGEYETDVFYVVFPNKKEYIVIIKETNVMPKIIWKKFRTHKDLVRYLMNEWWFNPNKVKKTISLSEWIHK